MWWSTLSTLALLLVKDPPLQQAVAGDKAGECGHSQGKACCSVLQTLNCFVQSVCFCGTFAEYSLPGRKATCPAAFVLLDTYTSFPLNVQATVPIPVANRH